MRKNLISVLNYFALFSYAPSFDEIHLFYPVPIDKITLKKLIQNEIYTHKLVRLPYDKINRLLRSSKANKLLDKKGRRYTLPQYSIPVKKKAETIRTCSLDKPSVTIQLYISFLRALPIVRFVGITGASAMNGYTKNDDLDLFVITAHNRLWTTRFFAVGLAKILGIHGYRGVCLNLFFDETDMAIPLRKQNAYIAHELLQMKPLIDKGGAYSLLMEANRWILRLFPNAQNVSEVKPPNAPTTKKHIHSGIFERILKQIQLPIIKKNKTGFRITEHQLWLFKRDFERSLRRRNKL